jgi:ATP-binding cassette subfamily B (MDR/TAP) protein 1
MNKRVRDAAFSSLIRQEVSYYDLHPAGSLTTQLQDDAAMIHSFSGEPIRTLVMTVASLVVGVVIAFVFMW